MTTYRLTISVALEGEEPFITEYAKGLLSQIGWDEEHKVESLVALTRDGDRAALNVLLPKLEGRMGSHYQGKKAPYYDIIK
jgi:hypothetical protein